MAAGTEVAALTRQQREERVVRLVEESRAALSSLLDAIEEEGKVIAGIATLFSGGNDSTTLAHIFRDRATHHAHANTGVGIEETRQFVRNVSSAWGVPLVERRSPRDADSYAAMVRAHGFPGPGHHYKMFQRLKERALREVRKELLDGRNPRQHRVVFLAGRRREESARRTNIPELEREGSTWWLSPMAHWTKMDLNTYRLMHADSPTPVPVNRVSDLIHMSGERLCGAFAKRDERAEIEFWFPDDFDLIRRLEAELVDRVDLAPHAKVWGWGWEWPEIRKAARHGRLCTSCAGDA